MIDKGNIPKHIAIIMDGNGRWAKARGLPRTAGHRVGIDRVKEIVDAAAKLGIKAVTFFAFSTENWTRPKQEVVMLMRSLDNFLTRNIKKMDNDNIKFRVIGGGNPLPKYLQDKIKEAEEKTKNNTGLTVILALNYGGRQDIVKAARAFAEDALKGKVQPQELDIEVFSSYLSTNGLPDPDLLIRTSGEIRVSNFLLWQLAYAEFYFPNKHWPDFRKKDLEEAIEAYQARERRFGGLDAVKKNS